MQMRMDLRGWGLSIALFACLAMAVTAAASEPELEQPTLRCLGVHWVLDSSEASGVGLAYRKAGEGAWQAAMPLFRVEKGKHVAEHYGSRLEVAPGATLFAGSVVNLQPDTSYELRLTLIGAATPTIKTLTAHTRGEPRFGEGAPVRHVIPADGKRVGDAPGAGTQADPFRGLAAANAAARPGDVFLLHAGVYTGVFENPRSGEEGRPIVWRGESVEKVILDGKGAAAERPGRVIAASDTHDLWFENLTIRNADYGIVVHDVSRLVVRGCHIHGVDFGITATRNDKDHCRDFFIADNVIEGPSTWPRTKGIEDARGIQVTGSGHIVCYNRIRGFADAIDTYNSPRCEAIDFHNNDLSECTDDGIELDYSQRNVRCFENKLTNVFQGISVQPVFGGPVYIFRNVMYNVEAEPFKIHNSPSGVLFLHNTIVKNGPPMLVNTREAASNLFMRNNLYVGTTGHYAWECLPHMSDCDFDYDGFGGGPFALFMKWNGERYEKFEEMKARAPVERHAINLGLSSPFASGAMPPEQPRRQQIAPELTPKENSAVIDGGQRLPGFNDGFAGKGPDLGAYELGAQPIHYGPRPHH